jgi:signal-transduction protein with cAMP-binding, CBS, and nucleotidyltransferase domain/DNA polymerase III epsilon subunit-like protein
MTNLKHPLRIDAATPLVVLNMVVLDTETTGLDVRADRIVQIGAVRMQGAVLHEDETLDLKVNPGVPIAPASTRIHGIGDTDVVGAPATTEAIARLAGFIGEAVAVGHNINFDMVILRHEADRHGVDWREPRTLDLGLLGAALVRGRVDNSIEALALSHGVEITGRHTALGDALVTARIFAAMLGQLRERGVRSLAEAEAFQRRPHELIDQQKKAGWFAIPGERPDFLATADTLPNVQQAVDSFIYRHRLADVMGAPPITVSPEATLLETANVMREHGIGCVVVEPMADGGGGFVSERDVLYAFASRGPEVAGLPVRQVMSAPVISMPEDCFLYRALGLMARHGLRYLAATGADGAISGVFTLRSLLQERALATLSLGDRIAEAEDAATLAQVQAELPGLAGALLADGSDARQVAAIISAEGQAMTARAAELAEQIMEADGLGPAPAPYCLLVLGSGGRGESLLAPDQDNAVIVDDAYPGNLDADDDWFTVWAGHLNRLLDEAGIPLCKGGVMAKNRAWRKTLAEWCVQADTWVASPKPENLLNVDIFFDFAPVLGRYALAWRLRAYALDDAKRARVLIRALAENASVHGGALGVFGGMFGSFRKDKNGRTDLKAGALLALVSGARVIALAHHIGATATPERLKQATEKAGAGAADARILVDIHELVLRLILTQQIEDTAVGVPPSNAVDTDKLNRDQRKTLKHAIERLDLMTEIVQGVLA